MVDVHESIRFIFVAFCFLQWFSWTRKSCEHEMPIREIAVENNSTNHLFQKQHLDGDILRHGRQDTTCRVARFEINSEQSYEIVRFVCIFVGFICMLFVFVVWLIGLRNLGFENAVIIIISGGDELHRAPLCRFGCGKHHETTWIDRRGVVCKTKRAKYPIELFFVLGDCKSFYR